MTMDEFRDEMNAYWESVNKEADALKDSYLALERLGTLYGKFSNEERDMADQVITEWILGTDEFRRWDALVLVTDLKITRAVPALRALAQQLANSATRDTSLIGRVIRKADELEGSA